MWTSRALRSLAAVLAALPLVCAACLADPVAGEADSAASPGQSAQGAQMPDVAQAPWPIVAQGDLPWFEESLFLLEPQRRLSWLFRLREADTARFELNSFGTGAALRAQIKRWEQDAGAWREITWVEARADLAQALRLDRALDAGFYWLVIEGDATPEPLPFTLYAECASGECASSPNVPLVAEAIPVEVEAPRQAIFERERDAIGLSSDFVSWLEASRFASHDLAQRALDGGSYGGRLDAHAPRRHDPVLFIHGNSDRALGGPLGGWLSSIAAFREAGYSPGELYAFTWGDASPAMASWQYHSYANLMRVRAMIEAVLEYTGAEHLDMIAHSMGVTLARRAILGGEAYDALHGTYNLGAPLTARIDVFIGIAGANRGLVACALTGPTSPTCGSSNGLYPGGYWGRAGRSTLLKELDARAGYEGRFVATISSLDDEVINPVGRGGLIWGEPTSSIASEHVARSYEGLGHLEVRDVSAALQITLARDHAE